MGDRRNFSRGLQRFAYLFQVAEVTMQTDVHKARYCFCTTKKMPQESMRSIRIAFCSWPIRIAFSFHKPPNIHL